MKQKLMKIVLTTFVLLAMVGSASGQNVLVWAVGNESGDTQGVADYIMATGYFTSVTAVDSNLEPLAALLDYDALLYFSNSPDGADQVAIGNVLADYADTGRRLVLATFSWANQIGNTLEGRIIDDAISPLYFESSSLYTSVNMADNDGHAIFENVAFINGFFHDDVALMVGAEQHATWSDGEPLVADKGNVVAINLFPDVSWGSLDGDFNYLFANSLRHDVVATKVVSWGQVKAAFRGQ